MRWDCGQHSEELTSFLFVFLTTRSETDMLVKMRTTCPRTKRPESDVDSFFKTQASHEATEVHQSIRHK